jgi:hypothetical protein
MVAPQMLGQVIFPCEAVRTRAGTFREGAVQEFFFVYRFDVSVEICITAE